MKFLFNRWSAITIILLLGCNSNYVIKGIVESYDEVNLNGLPLYISIIPEGKDIFIDKIWETKVDRDGSFRFYIPYKIAHYSISLDVGNFSYYQWRNANGNSILSDPVFTYQNIDLSWDQEAKPTIKTFLFEQIVITDLSEEIDDIALLELSWSSDIKDVEIYSVFFRSSKITEGNFSVITTNNVIEGNLIQFEKANLQTIYKRALESSEPFSNADTSLIAGLYDVIINAYRIDEEGGYILVGRSSTTFRENTLIIRNE
jgi:hypothetical protein